MIRSSDLQLLIDALPHLVWVCRADGAAEHFNTRWREYTGQTPEQSLGDGWREVVHPDERERLASAWDGLAAEAEEWFVPYRLRRHDGTYRWFEARARRVRLTGDARPHWIGTSTDIDEQRRALDALQAQERRFSALIEYLPEAFVVHDQDGRILVANRNATELTGYSGAELLARQVSDLDDRFSADELRHRWRASLPGQTWQSASRHRRKDGSQVDVDVRAVCFLYGAEKLFLSLVNDATARLADEALLRQRSALLDLAPVVVFDLDGRVHYWSDGAAEFSGYSRAKALASNIVELLMPRFPLPFDELVAELHARGRWTGELGVRAADGSEIVALSQWTLYRDPRSAQELVLQVHADISALKRAQAALAATREEVRDYSQQFDAVVEEERLHIARELHDELGQRLTALKLDVHWLATRVERGLSAEAAAGERLRAMATIIDDTIAETRALSASLRPIGLEQLGLKSALESLLSGFTARTGIAADVSLDGAAQVPVAQKLAVYRIVQEALTNVARHSGANRVEVLLGRVDDQVRVEVHDNGVGLSGAHDRRARLGMVGMRERALAIGARLEISGEDGTSVVLEIPR